MAKLSKRVQALRAKVDRNKPTPDRSPALVKEVPPPSSTSRSISP
jgi:hypothetical protein